ncbi:MAG TPA: 5-methyltetrahydropteroyltriglutamate--homocysteine S-methyltransferase, partial [Thermomicrobiaceae bacterium]|nr:5-methyltetrahydropteroyltriglutamate--homocysteine S-methyltransferase [Thermomicrobiaceae bacterium]
MALSSLIGYPRIGKHRELKRAVEAYWSGKSDAAHLESVAQGIRQAAWRAQQAAGIDVIPCNDFSYYDQVLDAIALLGLVPERFGRPGESV